MTSSRATQKRLLRSRLAATGKTIPGRFKNTLPKRRLLQPHENDWYKTTNLTLPKDLYEFIWPLWSFNFTTDESSPEYEQVAIDPEMLGRVFESLLATQVDETGQQARKAKGAFYTPREIVSYMCRESLRNYLYGVSEDGWTFKSPGGLDRSDHEWLVLAPTAAATPYQKISHWHCRGARGSCNDTRSSMWLWSISNGYATVAYQNLRTTWRSI